MTKRDFDTKISSLDSKIAANKSKNESIENKLEEVEKIAGLLFFSKYIL